MNTNIPSYILERGTSAREYRRRSSCVSRSSNSSIGQQQHTQKDSNHSNEYSSSFADASLENYILDSVPDAHAQVGGHGEHLDRESTAEINLRRDSYVYRPSFLSDQEAQVSNDHPHFTGRSPIMPAMIADRTQRSQPQQQPQRFGVARPRLVHF